MVRTLDRYFAGRFLAIYAASLASFTLLYVLVDSVAQFNSLSAKSEGFLEFLGTWVRFYSAQVPIIFCRVLGAVTTAASASFAVTLFHRANELTPVLAAGVSAQRLLLPVVLLTGATAAGSAAVQEAWIPSRRIQIREALALGRGREVVRHAKHFDAARRILVVFRRYRPKEVRGEGVLVRSVKGYRGRPFILESDAAHWVEGGGRRGQWVLENGFIQEYDEEGNLLPPRPVPRAGEAHSLEEPAPTPSPGPRSSEPAAGRLFRTFDRRTLAELTSIEMLPAELEERQSEDTYRWFSEVREKVKRSTDSHRWRIRLYGRLADPLHGLILVFLCVPLVLWRGTRNIFLSALATVGICALYFMAYTLFLNLGNRGALSPGLAVGLAPVLFGALGVTLYSRMPS